MGTHFSRKFTGAACESGMFSPRYLRAGIARLLAGHRCLRCQGHALRGRPSALGRFCINSVVVLELLLPTPPFQLH